MAKMCAFSEFCSTPSSNVASMLDKKREEQYSHNASVIKSLLQCVCFCGKQGISFSGHRDDSTCKELAKRGNFMQLVDFRAQTDNILHEHLEKAPKNAKYTSKIIQN